MKVNFRIIEVQVSFEGEKRVFDIAREIGQYDDVQRKYFT